MTDILGLRTASNPLGFPRDDQEPGGIPEPRIELPEVTARRKTEEQARLVQNGGRSIGRN